MNPKDSKTFIEDSRTFLQILISQDFWSRERGDGFQENLENIGALNLVRDCGDSRGGKMEDGLDWKN